MVIVTLLLFLETSAMIITFVISTSIALLAKFERKFIYRPDLWSHDGRPVPINLGSFLTKFSVESLHGDD